MEDAKTVTVGDETFTISNDNYYGLYMISKEGSPGPLPDALRGKYTSYKQALADVLRIAKRKSDLRDTRPVRNKGRVENGQTTRRGSSE